MNTNSVKIVLRFQVERAKLTFGDIEDVQQLQGMAQPDLKTMRRIVQKFVVDENGQPLTEEEAGQRIRAVPLDEIPRVFDGLRQAMEGVAFPPVNSNG